MFQEYSHNLAKMPDIRHISFSSSGGAGRVASHLVSSLQTFGFGARLDVITDSDVRAIASSHPLIAATAVFDNYIVKRSSSRQLFTLARRSIRRSDQEFKNDDLLHLHWTPGALNLSAEAAIRPFRPIVWTLHDLWPITGGCHQALECCGFRDGCTKCPVVKPIFRFAVQRAAEGKRRMMGGLPKMVICTPSRWLAKQVEMSSIAGQADIRHVVNPIDPVFHRASTTTRSSSAELTRILNSIPDDAFVVGFVAKNLDDPNKRINLAIDVLRRVKSAGGSRHIVLLAVGSSRQPIHKAGIDIRSTGTLASVVDQKAAYQKMDVLLVVSDAETAPLVIDEALACGTPVVVRNVGGAAESVTHCLTGFVCATFEELIVAVSELYKNEVLGQSMSEATSGNWGHELSRVTETYIKIYNEMLAT